MSYITREDGERFVIPSYRDVLTAKQGSQLKKEVMLLSQSYGEYITMQRKGTNQYEVTFSPDSGYLLGESVWSYFKRPADMVYCEAIPNTSEAILVIVKSGSVYLDGSFPVESIPEELVIFLTQENHFEIYVYGDVPISQHPEVGKFSFEESSVSSFTVLDKPIFPTLPLQKAYQLQPVNQVLKAQGIGALPVRMILIGCIILGLLYFGWSMFFAEKKEVVETEEQQVNPFKGFYTALSSPAPDEQIETFLMRVNQLYTMPGWQISALMFSGTTTTAEIYSIGGSTANLNSWADRNGFAVGFSRKGFMISITDKVPGRPLPKQIYPIKSLISAFVDRMASVYPGNTFTMSETRNKGVYSEVTLTIRVNKITPMQIRMIGSQLKDLPLILQNMKLQIETDGTGISGTISLLAVGN